MQRHEQHVRKTQSGSSLAVSHTRPKLFIAGGLGIAILLLAYSSLTWNRFVANVGVCPQLFCDFVDYYLPMGKAIFHTGLPVDGFLYSPFNAILLAAFPPLGLDVSLILWGILQATAIVLCLLLLHRLLPGALPFHILVVSLTLFSYPLWLNFLTGNTSTFIMVALIGALWAVERGHYITAAFLLAFASSFKFYPVIFLVPFLACRNARFALLGAAPLILLLCLIPSAVLGTDGAIEFYGALIASFRESDWVTANPHSQFFPHVALRLLGADGTDAPIAHWVLWILSYAIAATNLVFVYRIQRARVYQVNLWSFSIVFLTTPFVLKTSWPIDFAFLPFVQSFLLWHVRQAGSWTGSRGARTLHTQGTTSFYLVLLSILISNVVFFDLLGDFSLYGYGGFLFLATALLLAAIYIEHLPALWQSREHPKGAARLSNEKGSVS